ncbi:MAG: hypothetical protein IH840_01795 [Candidatus Heimdallarchaeota archaeon]|nr:hypothetical protein [Candidatus Heimdallarchaeota archaeon]
MRSTITHDPSIAFKDIWTHHAELQNWSSSSWWFFLLLPRQEKGYGPKQLMFTYASRTGSEIKVNSTWQKGFDPNRRKGKIEQFMTTVVGWINDGTHVHEQVVHQPALATLDYEQQRLEAWETHKDGNSYGATLQGKVDDKYSIEANFVGKKGSAKFTIWNAGLNPVEVPNLIDVRGPNNGKLGGTNLVAWRKASFKGTFTSPSGKETLEGHAYFQRVLMNVPMFPWFWNISLFENGSLFSAFVPYMGLQAIRRDYYFYPQWMERMIIPLGGTAYFHDAKTGETTGFDRARVYPEKNGNDHPNFIVKAESLNGDKILLRYRSHNHAQFLLDRRIFQRLWQTKFNYNEYMIEVVKMTGKIDGKPLNMKVIGKGWGNMEYCWGMSL